jgi:hypothetical protein
VGRRRNKKSDILGPAHFLQGGIDSLLAQEDAAKRIEQERLYDAQAAYVDAGLWTLDEVYALERAANELYKRDSQALNLYKPIASALPFHNSLAGERGIVGSNRAGKSVAASVEVAWAATGTHPIKDKYPIENMEICIVGPRLEHLRLLYYILFKKGKTFKVLRDGINWIIPKWTVPEHEARQLEWEDAPPLIPPEMVIDDITWYSRTAEQPAIIRLTNGTNLYFFSFEQDAPRGVAFHLCWLDEESPGVDKWISELRARAISVMGRLIWSSTPESATPTFYDLKTRSERPDMAAKVPYKRTEFFELFSRDNPYLPPLGLEAASERLHEDDPEAAAAKIDGEWTFRRFLVYPEFNENIHIIEPFEIEWRDSVYAIIDPGRTRNGTLFVALLHPESPHYLPDQPDRLVCFDELYMETARYKGGEKGYGGIDHKRGDYVGINSKSFAKRFAEKWLPYKHWIEDITFDWKHGAKKEGDFDVEIMEQYREALEERVISPRIHSFVRAKHNIDFGIEEVSKHLVPEDGKPPKLVIMRGKCPQLAYGFKKYQREQLKGSNGRLTPGKPIAKRNEMVDCVRYACCRGYTWVMPPSQSAGVTAFTGQELARMANSDKAFLEFVNRDFYKQFDRKPKVRR